MFNFILNLNGSFIHLILVGCLQVSGGGGMRRLICKSCATRLHLVHFTALEECYECVICLYLYLHLSFGVVQSFASRAPALYIDVSWQVRVVFKQI